MAAEGHMEVICMKCEDCCPKSKTSAFSGKNPLARVCFDCAAIDKFLTSRGTGCRKVLTNVNKRKPESRRDFYRKQKKRRIDTGRIDPDCEQEIKALEKEVFTDGTKDAELVEYWNFEMFEEKELMKGRLKNDADILAAWEANCDDDDIPKIMCNSEVCLVKKRGGYGETYRKSEGSCEISSSSIITKGEDVAQVQAKMKADIERRRKSITGLVGHSKDAPECKVDITSHALPTSEVLTNRMKKDMERVTLEKEEEEEAILLALMAAAVTTQPQVQEISPQKDDPAAKAKLYTDLQTDVEVMKVTLKALETAADKDFKEALASLKEQVAKIDETDASKLTHTATANKFEADHKSAFDKYKTDSIAATMTKWENRVKGASDESLAALKEIKSEMRKDIASLSVKAKCVNFKDVAETLASVTSLLGVLKKAEEKRASVLKKTAGSKAQIDDDAVPKVFLEIRQLEDSARTNMVVNVRAEHEQFVLRNKAVMLPQPANDSLMTKLDGYFDTHVRWARSYAKTSKLDTVVAGIVKLSPKKVYSDAISKFLGADLVAKTVFDSGNVWGSEIFDLQIFFCTPSYKRLSVTHFALPEVRIMKFGYQVIAGVLIEDVPGDSLSQKIKSVEAMSSNVFQGLCKEHGFFAECFAGDVLLIPCNHLVLFCNHEQESHGVRYSVNTKMNNFAKTVANNIDALIAAFPVEFPANSSYQYFSQHLKQM